MNFKFLLFDFDNTLVDFTTTSKHALWQTFTNFNVDCNADIEASYKQVNHQVWAAFERGEITAKRLRVARFELLFKAIGLTPTTAEDFSRRFLENLVTLSTAYAGTHQLLQSLSNDYGLGLITNGLREVQRPRLDKLKMRDYFQPIVVSDEIGLAKPQTEFFAYAYERLPDSIAKREVLVIGDSLNSDIIGGRNFGFATCWISHGRENITDIQPDFTLNQVRELPDSLAERRDSR